MEGRSKHGFPLLISDPSFQCPTINAFVKPKDTRTLEQKGALLALLRELKRQFPKALIFFYTISCGGNLKGAIFDKKLFGNTLAPWFP